MTTEYLRAGQKKSLLLLSWNEATAQCEKKKWILVSLNRAAFINFHLIYLRKFNYSVIFLVLFNSGQGTMGKRWGLRDLLRRLYCRKDELIFLPLRPSLLACPLHQQLPEVPEGGRTGHCFSILTRHQHTASCQSLSVTHHTFWVLMSPRTSVKSNEL